MMKIEENHENFGFDFYNCIVVCDVVPLGSILSMFLEEYKNFRDYMRKLWISRGGNRYKFTGEYHILLKVMM